MVKREKFLMGMSKKGGWRGGNGLVERVRQKKPGWRWRKKKKSKMAEF